MNRRLQQFLEVEQLSPARLADTLGIQRSGISHLLSGRNKPSYEFIRAIMLSYPNLNMEWLLVGKGKMYKDSVLTLPAAEPMSDLLFGEYEMDDKEWEL